MPSIRLEDSIFECNASETVLDCLGRNGIQIPSSCRTGVCQTCVMRAVAGDPPSNSQKGLKDTMRSQGYFLACVCKPITDLEICMPDSAGFRIPAKIVNTSPLSDSVIRVGIQPCEAIEYRPGQFMNIVRPDGLARSYSIASVPELDPEIELHVALVPNGKMSGWLEKEVSAGQEIELQGPHGDCFYLPGRSEQPLFLLGTGTGLAPLYGIVRDALRQGHRGEIHLFHGGMTRDSLYLVEQLRESARQHPQFRYHPCTFEADGEHDVHLGYIDDVALSEIPSLRGWRIFICGDPRRVRRMKRRAFLAGANLDDILSDSFVPSPTSS